MNSLPIDYEISRGRDIVVYLSNKVDETTLDQVIKAAQQHTKLVNFLKWFSKTYCCEYSEIYMGLFGALDLFSPYSGVSEEWTLWL